MFSHRQPARPIYAGVVRAQPRLGSNARCVNRVCMGLFDVPSFFSTEIRPAMRQIPFSVRFSAIVASGLLCGLAGAQPAIADPQVLPGSVSPVLNNVTGVANYSVGASTAGWSPTA